MTTVACVLRGGGEYTPPWVYALKRRLNEHCPEHRFVCLSDVEGLPPVWRVPLEHRWRGWWSKMELFRPGLFEPGERVVYMDLDTLILDDPSEVFEYDGEFGMIQGFYRPVLQSGFMAFTPGDVTERLWRSWIVDPVRNMAQHRGDGEWIASRLTRDGSGRVSQRTVDLLPEMYPGRIVSFKVHCRMEPPEDAPIVCGHGHPRFNDPVAGWAHRYWKGGGL